MIKTFKQPSQKELITPLFTLLGALFLLSSWWEYFFENKARLKGVNTLGHQSAHALNDPVRIKILEILSHKQMTTEEMSKILRRTGHKKAMTTISIILTLSRVPA